MKHQTQSSNPISSPKLQTRKCPKSKQAIELAFGIGIGCSHCHSHSPLEVFIHIYIYIYIYIHIYYNIYIPPPSHNKIVKGLGIKPTSAALVFRARCILDPPTGHPCRRGVAPCRRRGVARDQLLELQNHHWSPSDVHVSV